MRFYKVVQCIAHKHTLPLSTHLMAGVVCGGAGTAADATEDLVDRVPFLVIAMDLPPAPLYKDALEKNIIPQVPALCFM